MDHHPNFLFVFGPVCLDPFDVDFYGQVADDDIPPNFGLAVNHIRKLTDSEIAMLSDPNQHQVISDDCFDPKRATSWDLVTFPEDPNGDTDLVWVQVTF